MKLSESTLRRWRRYLLIRDCVTVELGGKTIRQAHCSMCNNVFPTWRLQAHHLKPKSLYPEEAYDLSNGIMLCTLCHIGIVHSGNAFRDIQKIHHWKFFLPAFRRHNQLAKQARYNKENQTRIVSNGLV